MKNYFNYFLIIIFTCQFTFAQAPFVTSTSPQQQILNAPRNTSIIANFNIPLNPLSVNNSTFRVFGKQLGTIPGTFELLNGNTQVKFTPLSPFLAGEWVTVALSKGIKSQNDIPMALGYNWNFWTIAGPGTLNQSLIRTIPVRRQGEGLIQCYGALGVDLNDDGNTDLAVVNEISRDFRVFLNNGINFDTIFAIYPIPNGSFPSPSEAGDFNHDGKVDIIIGNAGNNVLSLFTATGGANYLPGVSYTAATNVRGVAVADLDGDGHDDIVTANRGGNSISLFKNNGDGTFASANNINTPGSQETAVMMTDANNDGVLDAFVGCYTSSEIVLMLGDGAGNLVFSSRSALNGQPWAIVVGDMNGDGNADVAAALSSANKIGVIFGNGTGGLGSVTTYISGQFPLAIDIGDLDGDNDLDLISSDYASGDYKVYGNNGSGVYTNSPITLQASSAGSCITVHDRDNDGDLDLSGIDEVDDLLFVFSNGPGPQGIQTVSDIITDKYMLYQNYPNPFNPTTKIRFDIGVERIVNPFYMLRIYNSIGKEIETLFKGNLPPGSYETEFNSKNYPSGIYFYRLESENFSETKRMVLLK